MLTLYGTVGCHLCDEAERTIAQAAQYCPHPAFNACFYEDIADADDLMERFSTRIPVLKHDASDEVLDWPFDAESVLAWLARVEKLKAPKA